MTLQRALRLISLFEEGRYKATLEDALKWEEFGLGRVRFIAGRPTWVR